MRHLLLAAAAVSLVSCTAIVPQPITQSTPRTAASAEAIEGDLRYLASDALEGRRTGTRGYQAASQYVADRLAAYGLQPGGTDGTWFQPVDLLIASYAGEDANTLVLSGPNAPEGLVEGKDYFVDTLGNRPSGTVTAPLVFVGQGFVDPRTGRDDFAGVDVAGKIAVTITGSPKFLGGEERAYFSNRKLEGLAERGAVGTITLRTPELYEDSSWEELVEALTHNDEASWIGPNGVANNGHIGLDGYATFTPEVSALLMANQPMTLEQALAATNDPDGRPKAFDMGMTATIDFSQSLERLTSRNVVGLIEGTDPVLRHEYVVLSAHLDHLGVNEDAEPGEDRIANGAMDNASGTAIMMDVARRLAADPPRRSVLVIAMTAEEMGLIGSAYNAAHPTVPKEAIVANVNLDMPLLTYEFSDVIAFGVERSTMYPVVKAAADAAGIALTPDPLPDEGFFARSDHYSYVKQGIPAAYLDTGPGNGGDKAMEQFLKDHYHDPSDEVALVDFTQAARFADLNYEVARGVANMDERPLWKKGDFFGTAFNGPMED